MENLIIHENNNEFYYADGNKMVFLSEIKDINLFIGANNTRKSRLLRNIAKIENKVVFTDVSSLNSLYFEGIQLAQKLEELSNQYQDVVLLKFSHNGYQQVTLGKRFAWVREFFHRRTSPEIRYIDIKTQLESILSYLIAPDRNFDIETLATLLNTLHDFADLMTYLYGYAEDINDLAYRINDARWEEENVATIVFRIPDRTASGQIDNLTIKAEILGELTVFLGNIQDVRYLEHKGKSIYIPVLRSSRNLLTPDNTIAARGIFKSTIAFQYFGKEGPPKHVTVHTGQEYYDLIDQAKRGKTKQRRDFKEFESFIGKSFYQSSDIEIIAHNGGGHPEIIVSLPNELPDIPIYDLGDGVQAIINLFFPIFTAEEESWVFIDEPELNLHPGFQNLFIRTLLENEFLREKQLRYFINSHSNHILSEVLLGGSEQSEIFVFSRKDEYSTFVQPFDGFENATLDLLGVMNTSTLVSNCSVWVEGITDRLYLRAFLTAYIRQMDFQPIEGLNYSFIEYGGKNLVHYLFEGSDEERNTSSKIDTFFTARNIYLLADTDTNKAYQHTYYASKKSSRFHYEHTEYPEIENILPKKILEDYLIEKLKLDPLQVKRILNKSFTNVKLGKYLSEAFAKEGIDIKISSRTGGTLAPYYKSSLAEYVLQQVQLGNIEYGQFKDSGPISRITYSLYEFIANSNERSDAVIPF